MALNIFGRTEIRQSNGAVVVLQDVEVLNGNRLVGGAFVGSGDGLRAGYITKGTVTDSSVDFDIQWVGARGHYSGQLNAQRKLSGQTHNVNNPSQQATWVSGRQF
ncbi:hypothetical protein ACPW96_18230 [Micromonospora sp. DT81.3]|uniref:hypothetical protein n=1 Tax=Micromonospora sp. DT81.3 TaxID=3416523 RepID=UPI003CE8E660